jgi:DNA-binding NarL/FixJ family response regulator
MDAPVPVTVAIADDHTLVRRGLRVMLAAEPDIDVVAEAENGLQAVDAVRRTRPDVIVMDVQMPELDGIEATERIVAMGAATRVLVVTTFDLDEYVFSALRAGAAGFLLKEAKPSELAGAVRTVAAGDGLLAPRVTRRLVEHFADRPAPGAAAPAALEQLSHRELEVLRLIARGMSNAEIAAELFLSDKTVKSHVTRVLAKLGLTSRSQAVVWAYESGVVRVGEAAPVTG